jgi:hypothetical protein
VCEEIQRAGRLLSFGEIVSLGKALGRAAHHPGKESTLLEAGVISHFLSHPRRQLQALVWVPQFNFSEYHSSKRPHIDVDRPVHATKWDSVPNFLKNVALTERSQHLLGIGTWNFILKLWSANAFPRTLDREPSPALSQTDTHLPFSKAGDQAVPHGLAVDYLRLPTVICEKEFPFDFKGHQ